MSTPGADDAWLASAIQRQRDLPESDDERHAREKVEYRAAEKEHDRYLYEDRTPPGEARRAMNVVAHRWGDEVRGRWPEKAPSLGQRRKLAAVLRSWSKRYGLRAAVADIAVTRFFERVSEEEEVSRCLWQPLHVGLEDVEPSSVETFLDYLKRHLSDDDVLVTSEDRRQSAEQWERILLGSGLLLARVLNDQ
ncbi:MAG: hypothetical protein F2840_15210 [Actinobacteria bacterium]|uniref:Unannotated protein n=1 Tax=freshwater metagenome TaxID=449393 RepID=A0A6J7LR22_9ZZZZ|nr:hypothetical protein [Actinomycetota bacterium]